MKLLEAVGFAVKEAAKFNRSVQAQPEAVLWTDADRQWQPVVDALSVAGRPILTLGDYVPEKRQGQAIWLKCALAGKLEDVLLDGVPVLYLPGVSRADLRAIESFPRHLQPLSELQYRGVFWTQVNAKDWTLNAFLTSKKGGLGLDVAQDQATQKALLRALSAGELMNKSVEELQGRFIDAAWLDGLLAPNPTRDVLVWMNDPTATEAAWQGARWEVFVSRCRKDFDFDPAKDGELTAAERLAARAGPWSAVWELYKDAYSSFPAVMALLSRVRYQMGDLFADASTYPKANEEAETALRYQLHTLSNMAAVAARKAILEAEKKHGERRQWLWAQMGKAPLARALGHLALVAQRTAASAFAGALTALTERYREEPAAVVRPVGRYVDQAGHRVLPACAGCALEGAGGLMAQRDDWQSEDLRIEAYLQGLDVAALRRLILEASWRDDALREKLLMAATVAESSGLSDLTKVVKQATRTNGFVEYSEAGNYANRLEDLAELLSQQIADGQPKLIEVIIRRWTARTQRFVISRGRQPILPRAIFAKKRQNTPLLSYSATKPCCF